MRPDEKGHLPIAKLPDHATESNTFKDLHSASLLSIGQLCDTGCSALFTKQNLKVFNDDKELVLTGQRNYSDGLWDVKLSSLQPAIPPPPSPMSLPPAPSAHVILTKFDKPKSTLANYFHAAVYQIFLHQCYQ